MGLEPSNNDASDRAPGAGGRLSGGRQVALLVGLVVCAWMTTACSGDAGEPDINDLPFGIRHVLVISIDTLRADFLGCYGHDFVKSPAIDQMSGEGVRFSQVMSAAPTTLASHTSLFTGKYPHSHGVPRNGYEVPEVNEMLAEVLGTYGFTTAGFVGAAPLDTDVMFHQGFDTYNADFTLTEDVREGIYQRSAPEVNDAVLGWLDGRELKSHDRLFLFLHYFDVHAPYTVPTPFGGMYASSGEPADASTDALKVVRKDLMNEARGLAPGGRRNPPEEGFARRLRDDGGPALVEADAMIAEYAAGVTWTDHHLGNLFEGLRERGLFDETLIILTADHGETLYDHANLFNHGNSVYASETHVPLLVRFPGGEFAGERIEEPVSNIDVMPTLLDLLGLPAPDGIEGVSLARLLAGEALERGPIFSEATKPYGKPKFNADPLWKNQGKYQAVRSGPYKYLFRLPDNKFRLFDMGADPDEERNLLRPGAEAPANLTAIEERLDGLLREWRASAAPLAAEQSTSDAQRRALEALGYSGASEVDRPPERRSK
ncbi:MAG: arylsulfatase A-like enzyme [Planctomycetota bacterium]|jgi:arylsulfatase A-like enzyme